MKIVTECTFEEDEILELLNEQVKATGCKITHCELKHVPVDQRGDQTKFRLVCRLEPAASA